MINDLSEGPENRPIAKRREPRKPEFGDSVVYMAGDKQLSAIVQVVFADGGTNLRVTDPGNAFGYFDVKQSFYDEHKVPGTWCYPGD